ncbi:MAG: prepilin-type N-terminal cleavage/methylation domain-containing protein [Leptolyngbya sp. PLA1]|nr:prepilin-type N-terminal cleavage/methylation domain-containing protein [Leptolyngbya sp. PLA1]
MSTSSIQNSPRFHRAFSLIELLVTIAIIALLIAIALPALSKARQCVRTTRELAAAQQLMIAYATYADANRGRVLTGYPTAAMVSGAVAVTNSAGERLTGDMAQRYPWRLAPHLDFNFRGLYQDDRVLADLLVQEDTYRSYGVTYDYVVSLYPSLGLNVAFVGGSERHSQFDPAFTRAYGKVHIERSHEPLRPSNLLVFASARAEVQPALPIPGQPQGFFRIEPPIFGAARGRQWEPAYEERADLPGLNSGFVSLRHGGRAVTARFDGHAQLNSWTELGDMRLWADQANSPDWGLVPRP